MKFKLLFLSCAVFVMGSRLIAYQRPIEGGWSAEDVEQKQQEMREEEERRARLSRAEQENRASNQMPQATADSSGDMTTPQATAIDDITASAPTLTKQQQRQQRKAMKAKAQESLKKAEEKKAVPNPGPRRQAPRTTPVEEGKKMGEKPSSEAITEEITTCKESINAFIGNATHLANSYQVGLLAADEIRQLIGFLGIPAAPRYVVLSAFVKQIVDRNNDPKALGALLDLLYGIEDRLLATFKQEAIQTALEDKAKRAKEEKKFMRKQRKSEPKKHVNPKVVEHSEFSVGVTQNLTDKLKTQLEELINRLAEEIIGNEHFIQGSQYRQKILHFADDYRIYFRRDVLINDRAKLVLLLFEKKSEQGGIIARADGAFVAFCTARRLDTSTYLGKR
jgi:hypothetical protein